MKGLRRAGGWALMVIAVGCKAEAPATEDPVTEPAGTVAPDAPLIAGTPAGDIEQWIADIRSGLAGVEPAIDENRSEAHKRVLDLYVTRQEYIEMYYGLAGRMQPAPELAEAVKLNETRFHELMRLTGAVPPASADSVRGALKALEQQLAVVEANANRATRRVRSTP